MSQCFQLEEIEARPRHISCACLSWVHKDLLWSRQVSGNIILRLPDVGVLSLLGKSQSHTKGHSKQNLVRYVVCDKDLYLNADTLRSLSASRNFLSPLRCTCLAPSFHPTGLRHLDTPFSNGVLHLAKICKGICPSTLAASRSQRLRRRFRIPKIYMRESARNLWEASHFRAGQQPDRGLYWHSDVKDVCEWPPKKLSVSLCGEKDEFPADFGQLSNIRCQAQISLKNSTGCRLSSQRFLTRKNVPRIVHLQYNRLKGSLTQDLG